MNNNLEQQKRIEKAVQAKHKHWTKTELSIMISWSINNAVNSLSEEEKSKDWALRQDLIRERYDFFIKLHRDWMFENREKEKDTPELERAKIGEQVDSLKREEEQKIPF
ncbi:MAG: hypothetical protein ACTSQE_06955 [Candidatus Heimdallarchaeaceae archaeon]